MLLDQGQLENFNWHSSRLLLVAHGLVFSVFVMECMSVDSIAKFDLERKTQIFYLLVSVFH